jgi:hypothetical protein
MDSRHESLLKHTLSTKSLFNLLKRKPRTGQQQNNISNVKNRISSSQNAANWAAYAQTWKCSEIVKICQPIDKQAPECYSLCSRCDTTTQPSLLFAGPPGSYLCFNLQAVFNIIEVLFHQCSNTCPTRQRVQVQ